MLNSRNVLLLLTVFLMSGLSFATTNTTTGAGTTTTGTTTGTTTNNTTATPNTNSTTGTTTATPTNNTTSTTTNTLTSGKNKTSMLDKSNTTNKNKSEKPDQFIGDATITATVKSELLASKDIRSLSISVATDKGVVTLNGTVESAVQKDEVVKITSQVAGVKSVIDQLTVDRI